MKKCPNCNQIYSDDNLFCLNDGTSLLLVSDTGQTPPIFPTSENMPTQFISRSQPNLPNSSSNIPGWLYAVLGAMAAIIVALGVAFFVTRAPSEKEIVKTEPGAKTNENVLISNKSVVENKTNETTKENTNLSQSEISTQQIESPPITAEAVRGLLIRWEKAQDTQSYRAYQTCYGQPFRGIKRVESETKVYNLATWLNDRRKVLGNAIGLDVEIKNLQISIEGDTATAEFDQYYRSLRHSDWGPKILKLKMFPDGAKIVYEELKVAYPLN